MQVESFYETEVSKVHAGILAEDYIRRSVISSFSSTRTISVTVNKKFSCIKQYKPAEVVDSHRKNAQHKSHTTLSDSV